MILIGNIQSRQHGQPHRIDGIRGLSDRPHLRVDVLRQLQNVFRIRPPQVIRLIKNFHPHATTLRVFQRRILSSGSHYPLPCHSERSYLVIPSAARNLLSASISSTLPIHPTCQHPAKPVSRSPNSPAPPQSIQSAPASSPPARESLPALCATEPPRAATLPTAPRVLPSAAAPVARRVPPPPVPAAPPYTSR